jgi:prolyl-tRNA synthetase
MGVTRLVGAAIEQCHDDAGIVWPEAIAPFDAHVVALNYARSDAVRDAADRVTAELEASGLIVLLDDRDERPGVKFADADLIGIPHRIVVGERNLKSAQVEYRKRADADSVLVDIDRIAERIGSARKR